MQRSAFSLEWVSKFLDLHQAWASSASQDCLTELHNFLENNLFLFYHSYCTRYRDYYPHDYYPHYI